METALFALGYVCHRLHRVATARSDAAGSGTGI